MAGSFLASEQFCVTLYVRFVWQAQYFSTLPNIFCATWTQGSLVTPPPFCVAGANQWRQWWPYFLFVWQVQYFRCLGKFLVTLFLFCVAGALVTRPPRSTLWPHVLFVWQVLYVRCLRQVLVTWTQGSLVTPPLFWCGRPPRSSADTAKGWLWPYVLFVWHVQ